MSQNDSGSQSGSGSGDESTDAGTDKVELEVGNATLVYQDPEEGRQEVTVPNEQLVYVQDHWAYVVGKDDRGHDRVRRIPRDRVLYVDRDVQKFEEEVKTVRHRVESIADEVRQKLPMKIGDGQKQSRSGPGRQASEPRTRGETIPIDQGEESERGQ